MAVVVALRQVAQPPPPTIRSNVACSMFIFSPPINGCKRSTSAKLAPSGLREQLAQ